MRELTEAGRTILAASRVAAEQIQLQCGKAAREYASKSKGKKLLSCYHHLSGGQRVKLETTLNGELEVYATRGSRKTVLLARSKPSKWCVLAPKFDTSVDLSPRYT